MLRRCVLFVLIIVLLFWLLSRGVSACPNCKNALPDSDDPFLIFRLRNGYVWTYIGMSSVPFLSLGVLGGILYRRVKRANSDQTPRN